MKLPSLPRAPTFGRRTDLVTRNAEIRAETTVELANA
jgi:hypothetical protein